MEGLQIALSLLSPVVTVAVLIIAWLNRERLGLSLAQGAAREARTELTEIQEKLIAHLRVEVEELKHKVSHLTNQNDDLMRRIAALEDERYKRDTK